MKVQVSRFRQALKVVKPAVAGLKTTLPVTRNVLVQDGRLHATNLELAISVPLPELAGEPFTFPARQMEEILAHLPGYETLVLSVSNHVIQLQTPKTTFSLKGEGAEEFPPPPGPEPHEAEVDGDAFLAGLADVRPYASIEESRPVLTGLYVALGDRVEVAAADGFRLGWQTLDLSIAPRDGVSYIIIPAKTVDVLQATWRAVPKAPAFSALTEPPHEASLGMAMLAVAKRPMKLTFNAQSLSCQFGGVKVTTQLLAGTFPNYKTLIPTGQEKRVVVDAVDFAQALRQLAPLATAGSGIIRLNWEGTAIRLIARSEEAGTAEVTLPCSSQGGPAHIAFNLRYLQEYFRNREGPVMLEVTTPSSPGLFTYRGQPQFVLMPLFVKWEGGPTEVPAEAPPETPTVMETNDELTEAAAEGEPVTDGHDIPATPQAAPIVPTHGDPDRIGRIGEEPAEDRGEATNPTKSRRKSRRQASPI
jgi:DNA polymerase-3 subunit beta